MGLAVNYEKFTVSDREFVKKRFCGPISFGLKKYTTYGTSSEFGKSTLSEIVKNIFWSNPFWSKKIPNISLSPNAVPMYSIHVSIGNFHSKMQ